MTRTVNEPKRAVKRSGVKRNPRPDRSQGFDFARLTVPAREETRRNQRSKRENSPPSKSRTKYPVAIGKLQGWLGVRGGVSPKLRRLCDSGDEALILNQLLCYWFTRDQQNRVRARVMKARHRWVAKSHRQWAEELDMTRKQVRRSLEALAKKGFVEVRTWRFNGANTTHIRPLVGPLAVASRCPEDQKPYRRRPWLKTVLVTEDTLQRRQEERRSRFKLR